MGMSDKDNAILAGVALIPFGAPVVAIIKLVNQIIDAYVLSPPLVAMKEKMCQAYAIPEMTAAIAIDLKRKALGGPGVGAELCHVLGGYADQSLHPNIDAYGNWNTGMFQWSVIVSGIYDMYGMEDFKMAEDADRAKAAKKQGYVIKDGVPVPPSLNTVVTLTLAPVLNKLAPIDTGIKKMSTIPPASDTLKGDIVFDWTGVPNNFLDDFNGFPWGTEQAETAIGGALYTCSNRSNANMLAGCQMWQRNELAAIAKGGDQVWKDRLAKTQANMSQYNNTASNMQTINTGIAPNFNTGNNTPPNYTTAFPEAQLTTNYQITPAEQKPVTSDDSWYNKKVLGIPVLLVIGFGVVAAGATAIILTVEHKSKAAV